MSRLWILHHSAQQYMRATACAIQILITQPTMSHQNGGWRQRISQSDREEMLSIQPWLPGMIAIWRLTQSQASSNSIFISVVIQTENSLICQLHLPLPRPITSRIKTHKSIHYFDDENTHRYCDMFALSDPSDEILIALGIVCLSVPQLCSVAA